jgi:hypothetical protein
MNAPELVATGTALLGWGVLLAYLKVLGGRLDQALARLEQHRPDHPAPTVAVVAVEPSDGQ